MLFRTVAIDLAEPLIKYIGKNQKVIKAAVQAMLNGSKNQYTSDFWNGYAARHLITKFPHNKQIIYSVLQAALNSTKWETGTVGWADTTQYLLSQYPKDKQVLEYIFKLLHNARNHKYSWKLNAKDFIENENTPEDMKEEIRKLYNL